MMDKHNHTSACQPHGTTTRSIMHECHISVRGCRQAKGAHGPGNHTTCTCYTVALTTEKLKACGGPDAAEQWERLMARVTPLGEAIFQLPSAAVRADLGAAITMGKYAGALAGVVLRGGGDKLNECMAQCVPWRQPAASHVARAGRCAG